MTPKSEEVVHSDDTKGLGTTKALEECTATVTATATADKPKSNPTAKFAPNVSLEDAAGFWSRWSLSFLTPILRYGNRKALEVEDLGKVRDAMEAAKSYKLVKEHWDASVLEYNSDRDQLKNGNNNSKNKNMPSLPNVLLKGFGKGLFYYAILCYVLGALLGFAPVIILGDLVRYFETNGNSDTFFPPLIEVILLGFIPAAVGILQTRSQVIMTHLSVFARTSISMLVYDATLTASSTARGASSTGEVINIMSNDTTQIQRFLQFIGVTLVAPFQIVIAIYLIYVQIGDATWVGVAFMILLAPMNGVVFAQISKLRKKVLTYSDSRVRLVSEILGGIRILKFYAWEGAFKNQIDKFRGKEMKALTRMAYVIAIGFSVVLLSAPIIQPILVFSTYVATSTADLTAAKAFTVIALFNIMRFPFAFLPFGLVQFAQAKIACGRITRYLFLPCLKRYVNVDENLSPGAIALTNASLVWSHGPTDNLKESKNMKNKIEEDKTLNNHLESGNKQPNEKRSILSNISCDIRPGDLVAVIGSVGCGKSSFLSAILGEMNLQNGEVSIGKGSTIGYCPQTPFIINTSLRDNILFTGNTKSNVGSFEQTYDKSLYENVLDAACLRDDLRVLPSADITEIGERGINLSGGQKARVSLARCMYSQASIWLLDDPLSAVDAHVGAQLIQNIINPPLKNEKETLPTRILVTHHVHVLPMCDIVYVLDEGKVVEKGTYDELIQRGVDIAGAVEFEKEQNEVSDEDETKGKTNDFEKNHSNGLKSSTNVKGIDAGSNNKASTFDKLTSKEERATGSIDFSAYLNYARIGGYLATIFTILAQGVGRGFEIGSAFWLSYWSSQMIDENDTRSTQYYLNIYALISMCAVFMQLIRSLLLARHRLKASTTLHENLTKSILSAPVSFFDITPIGRILNRFASDMDKVDLELSGSLSQAISTVFSIIGAVTAISAATKGIFLLPLMPLGAAYYYLQRWFRSSSTELQRLVSITASPIFVDFSETLNGITSIRAYDLQSAFFDTTLKNFDINNIAYTTLQHANSWLGLRLDALGGFIAAFVGGLSLATYSSGSSSAFIPAGWLGLSLTYSNELSQYLKHGVRMLAQVEAEMSSVERILYYTDSIDSEAPKFISNVDDVCEKSSWPQNGNITFENVSLRYRDGPLILKQLSLDIKSGERIGVVGRTGSGKSSLMNALFRIVELAEGKIIISGQDVSKLGTNILRSNLSIIPQDPVLFNNTIRYNIDPFKITTDDEIWHILRQVQLDEVVSNLEHKLEEVVAEGGENFSQGQRQLICIARALLRKPKILIMDEATASIDNATDALIQQMIRANFVGATILTIAHRLNTIMDSDRILVLEDGNVAEFDTPNTLMSISEGGVFKALVEKSRRSMRVSSRTNLASSI